MTKTMKTISVVVCGVALLAAAERSLAQQNIMPTGQSPVIADVNLGEIGLTGGRAYVSHVTVKEGFRMTEHTHTARWAIVMVIQGTIREHRGATFKDYKAGDLFVVQPGTMHYNENAGTGPAIYNEFNITNAANTPPAAATTAK